ncbi:MAG: hypothetical protein JJ850_16305 [Kordiimonadaceae bacterium]|nr:hypothetical protein [Kordiimonadaceae bacterium]MBO6569651.1 hypothetical protein [Kordiimonadaceae bacterium]MBO6966186.1 hypothetical protein [Kordiimonadaceae bacterium]
MSRAKVEQLLGEPDGRTILDGTPDEPGHIYYSRYEFFFENGILDAMQNDNVFPKWPEFVRYESKVFRVEPWILEVSPKPNLAQTRILLSQEKIPFKQIDDYHGGPALRLESGVVLDFDGWIDFEDNEEAEPPLDEREFLGVRYFPNR